MPSDTFSHTVTVAATPDSIDRVLQMADTWKGIGPIDNVWDATHDGDRLTGFKWSARAAGKSWEGTAERAAVERDGAMTLDLDASEIAGAITVFLQPADGTTELTVELFARPKGMLAGMFWGVVSDALRSGLSAQIETFGDQF